MTSVSMQVILLFGTDNTIKTHFIIPSNNCATGFFMPFIVPLLTDIVFYRGLRGCAVLVSIALSNLLALN